MVYSNHFIGNEINVLRKYALAFHNPNLIPGYHMINVPVFPFVPPVNLPNPATGNNADVPVTQLYNNNIPVATGTRTVSLEKDTTMRNAINVNLTPPAAHTAAGETFRAYYLPWRPVGGAVRITLNPVPAVAAVPPAPRYFFTTSLSGCSVMVKPHAVHGYAQPTVFHCGIANWPAQAGHVGPGNDANGNAYTSQMIWQALVHHNVGGPAFEKVNYIDYQNDGQAGGGTARSRRVQGRLRSWKDGTATVQPYGAVFGMWHDAAGGAPGEWRFYLQECASLNWRYSKFPVPKFFRCLISTRTGVARPLHLRQFAPPPAGGGGNWRGDWCILDAYGQLQRN